MHRTLVIVFAVGACSTYSQLQVTDAGELDATAETGSSILADAGSQPLLDASKRELRSCLTIKQQDPAAKSAEYTLDVQGADGGFEQFVAYCDMDFEGGGWTLFQRWVGTPGVGPAEITSKRGATLVRRTDPEGAYLFPHLVRALAASATQVHIRSPSTTSPSRYVTSNFVDGGTSLPIANLRSLRILNADAGLGEQSQHWSGTELSRLVYSCDFPGIEYPSLYQSCLNNAGLHIVGSHATWSFQAGADPLEVYLR